jgi:hypothetical protein
MAYLQSITMLKIIGVIWLGSVSWFRHARPPLPAALDCRGAINLLCCAALVGLPAYLDNVTRGRLLLRGSER